MTIEQLTERFAIADAVQFAPGRGGLTRATIRTPLGEGELYLQGAHVLSFVPTGQSDLLFLSPASRFERGKAIRAGVPICFPWFGDRAGAASHGFARTSAWELQQTHQYADGSCEIVLMLGDDESTRSVFPHAFAARFAVRFGASLSMTLVVRNDSETPMQYESALHSYIAASDVQNIAVEGLTGIEYIDKTAGGTRARSASDALSFTGETDRIYLNSGRAVEVVDSGLRRRVRVEKEGARSTVIWTPWQEKAGRLSDLGDAWRGFVCVEAGNIADNAVTLSPGESHEMRQVISLAPF